MSEQKHPIDAFEQLQSNVVGAIAGIDLSAPQTSGAKIQAALHDGLDAAKAAALTATPEQLRDLVQTQAVVDARATFTRSLETDEAMERDNGPMRALVTLMRDVDVKFPFESLRVTRYVRGPAFTGRQLRVMQHVFGVANNEGEQRATRAMFAIGEAASHLYDSYASAVLKLLKLRAGNTNPLSPKFGAVINEIFNGIHVLGELPVNRNAAWLRNAAQHGHWKYLPASDEVVAWDDHQPRTTLPTKVLCVLAAEFHHCAGQLLVDAVRLHFNRSVYRDLGLMDAMLTHSPRVQSADPQERDDALQELRALAPVFESVKDLFDVE